MWEYYANYIDYKTDSIRESRENSDLFIYSFGGKVRANRQSFVLQVLPFFSYPV